MKRLKVYSKTQQDSISEKEGGSRRCTRQDSMVQSQREEKRRQGGERRREGARYCWLGGRVFALCMRLCISMTGFEDTTCYSQGNCIYSQGNCIKIGGHFLFSECPTESTLWLFKLRKLLWLETSFLSAEKQAFRHLVDSQRRKLRRQTGAAMESLCSYIMTTTSPEAEGKQGGDGKLQTNHRKHQGSLQQGAAGSIPRSILCSWAGKKAQSEMKEMLQPTRGGAMAS